MTLTLIKDQIVLNKAILIFSLKYFGINNMKVTSIINRIFNNNFFSGALIIFYSVLIGAVYLFVNWYLPDATDDDTKILYRVFLGIIGVCYLLLLWIWKHRDYK